MTELLLGLRLAFRARFLQISLCALLLLMTAAFLGAQFSGRQSGTIALDVGISVIRFALPVVGILLLQELVSREFDRKLYLTTLTYPRPRHQFLLGRIAAVGVLLFGLLVISAAVLAGLVLWVGQAQATPYDLGVPYLVTLGFISLDLLVVLATGTLIAVTSTTPNFVLIGTLGFMLVARSYAAIVALLARDITVVGSAGTYQSSLSVLGYLLPDLGALDVRMISLYGQWQFLPVDWGVRATSAMAYAAALFGIAVWALNRKKFA